MLHSGLRRARRRLGAIATLDWRGLLGPCAGAAGGALFMALLFAIELWAARRLQMMGVHDDGVEEKLRGRFGRLIALQQLTLFVAYLGLGGIFGGLVALGVGRWRRLAGRPFPLGLRLVVGFFGAAAIEGWRLGVTMIHYPQLFAEQLYAAGGAPRALQLFFTEHVPRHLLDGAGWVALVLFFVGPLFPATRRAWLRERIGRRLGLRPLVGGAALLVVGGLGYFAARPTAARADGAGPPNVLFLAVDSLRADRVGPGAATVAPHLAALAARSVHFSAAYVTIPRTFPSWSTLLTGRWPHHHGIRHMFPPAEQRATIGPALPKLLAERGYHTAVVSDFAGEIFSRLDVGFATSRVPSFDLRVVIEQAGLNLHPALAPYLRTPLGMRLAPALAAAADNADPDLLADRVIAELRDGARRGPFFLTAFFSAPHFPYAAPDPYYRRFTDPTYDGPFRYHKPIAAFGKSDRDLDARDKAQVRALYDGAVAAVDDAIGRVLAELERLGLAERTIVVVLADHGEALFDDDRGMGHGEHLRGDATLHIPLLIYDPVHRFPRHPVPGLVRDVDLAPTVARLTGGDLAGSDGVDLAPLLRGEKATLGLHAFAESGLWLIPEGPGFAPDERLPYPALPDLVTVRPDDDIVLGDGLQELVLVAKHRAVRSERFKLHYLPTRQGVRWLLHDLAKDPGEKVDVGADHPAELADLKARLYAWMVQDGSTVQAEFVVPR